MNRQRSNPQRIPGPGVLLFLFGILGLTGSGFLGCGPAESFEPGVPDPEASTPGKADQPIGEQAGQDLRGGLGRTNRRTGVYTGVPEFSTGSGWELQPTVEELEAGVEVSILEAREIGFFFDMGKVAWLRITYSDSDRGGWVPAAYVSQIMKTGPQGAIVYSGVPGFSTRYGWQLQDDIAELEANVEVTVDDTREVGFLGNKQIWLKISAAEDGIAGWVYAPHLVPVDRPRQN